MNCPESVLELMLQPLCIASSLECVPSTLHVQRSKAAHLVLFISWVHPSAFAASAPWRLLHAESIDVCCSVSQRLRSSVVCAADWAGVQQLRHITGRRWSRRRNWCHCLRLQCSGPHSHKSHHQQGAVWHGHFKLVWRLLRGLPPNIPKKMRLKTACPRCFDKSCFRSENISFKTVVFRCIRYEFPAMNSSLIWYASPSQRLTVQPAHHHVVSRHDLTGR